MRFLCYDWALMPAQAGAGWLLLEQPQWGMTTGKRNRGSTFFKRHLICTLLKPWKWEKLYSLQSTNQHRVTGKNRPTLEDWKPPQGFLLLHMSSNPQTFHNRIVSRVRNQSKRSNIWYAIMDLMEHVETQVMSVLSNSLWLSLLKSVSFGLNTKVFYRIYSQVLINCFIR